MPSGRPGDRPRRRPHGLAYLFLLLAIAVLSVAASTGLQLGATAMRRDAEQQLLTVGAEFERALRSYAGVAAAGPAPAGARGPRSLGELLRDPRAPGIRRHLRQVYADPLTGRPDWGLERDAQGFIVAVYSLAPGRPIRSEAPDGEEAQSYREWRFGLRLARAPGSRAPEMGRAEK